MNPVTLQRRHGPRCEAGRPVQSFTFEAEELRKGFKRCDCRIYAHGTLAGVFYRLATKQRDWQRAKEIVAPYLAAGSWDAALQPAPPPLAPPPGPEEKALPDDNPPGGTPIADAIKLCIKEQEQAHSAFNTIRQYRHLLGEFQRFSDLLGLRYIEEWKPATVRKFRSSWDVSARTATKKLGVLKPFFEIFVEDEVIASNPARIRTRRNRALRAGEKPEGNQKKPFLDAELERMFEACRNLGQTEKRLWPKKRDGRQVVAISEYRQYHRTWTGEDLADFMQLSYLTGLRISDVATFHADRLKATGEVKVRATKNGNWVCVWIPEWAQAMIRRRARTHGPFIFGKHATNNINAITDVWRKRLNKLWAACGPWEDKPTHHRFRHTFIRLLLERHTPLSIVAALTGDTEAMIQQHYSAWMPGRQESVNRVLQETFANAPRFAQG